MRYLIARPSRGLAKLNSSFKSTRRALSPLPRQSLNGFFTLAKRRARGPQRPTWPLALVTGGFFIWWLYPSEGFAAISSSAAPRKKYALPQQEAGDDGQDSEDKTAWGSFARNFESFSIITDLEWAVLSDKLVDFILPEWSKMIPGYMRKLQHELSMSPGSLADEIWKEAHDPLINPEIRYSAQVRVSPDLCSEEKEFLSRRRKVAKVALAKYLGLEEKDIHPDDVPTIAMCGSGGGLRALVAGTGSLLATEEDGLFDCVTYTSGVSGSCWLQMLYLTSFTKGSINSLLQHLKSRAGTHIAYPPVAFQSLVSLPTSKYLLSGMVEKLKGDVHADFGLVDIYGLLLAARYLVPKGELGVDDRDFKISNQREFIKYGEHPMPIYTAVRHEIPDDGPSKPTHLTEAQKAAWFQWYEISPYEFFCEDVGAGIPTWAMGRKFEQGKDVPPEDGFHMPEIRAPLLMGIFGSAFCATLSHYYREIRPLVKSMSGLGAVDDLISGRDDDLTKIHPIDPANIPNYAYQMKGQLPETAPESIHNKEYIQLMDAGMSNNLPIYPLLRPGREVDVIVAFDASADIKTDNWISVVEGYAQQRGIKGWPVGIGWPKAGQSASKTRDELDDAQAKSTREAENKLADAKADQEALRKEASKNGQGNKTSDGREAMYEPGDEEAGELGYCTVWVGSTQERKTKPDPSESVVTPSTSWKLTQPDAGIAVVYLPFMSNDAKVPGLSPGTTDFLSTWNFVYKPEQIDDVVRLARANYDEGKEQIRATVRAVYERKKKLRLEGLKELRNEKLRTIARQGEDALLSEGDQFS